MEQNEVKEESGDIGGHAEHLVSILRSIRGQRKHFDQEEQVWRVGGRPDEIVFVKKLVVYGKQLAKGLEKMWEDQETQ